MTHLPLVTLDEMKVIQETLGDLELSDGLNIGDWDAEYLEENRRAVTDEMVSHDATLHLVNRVVQSYTNVLLTEARTGTSGILTDIVELVKDILMREPVGLSFDQSDPISTNEDEKSGGKGFSLSTLVRSHEGIYRGSRSNSRRSESVEGSSVTSHALRRNFKSKMGKSTKFSRQYRHRRMRGSVTSDSTRTVDSEVASETNNLIRVLLKGNEQTSSSVEIDPTVNNGRASDGSCESGEVHDVETMFNLDEELRNQIENIDTQLDQNSAPDKLHLENLVVSESDSDVELLDFATRRYLTKIQNKRPRRKQGLGFYLRKLKILESQIKDIKEGNGTLVEPLSEKDWKYLLSTNKAQDEEIENLGGERDIVGVEVSQEFELIMRCLEEKNEKQLEETSD